MSWATVSGPVTAYELWEATNSSFTGATQVYIGSAMSVALSGRGNGTYYYEVQACNTTSGTFCSSFTPGGNATVVGVAPRR